MKVAFIEKDAPGGKVVKTSILENYLGFTTIEGPDLAIKMLNHALANQVSYLYGEVIKINQQDHYWIIETNNNKTYYAKTVFIATGMVERKLGIPNELEYYGRGVSYCAICDASLYKGKEVAVVGGGNSAIEEAIYLAGIVQKVHLIHRRNQFRADAKIVENMQKIPNIQLYTPTIPLRLLVDQNGVKAIEIENLNDQQKTTIDISCLFPYIGLDPITNFVSHLEIVDQNGFIIVDHNMQTKLPGLYAGGDVINKSIRQVATAINDGAIAALNAKAYLDHQFNNY